MSDSDTLKIHHIVSTIERIENNDPIFDTFINRELFNHLMKNTPLIHMTKFSLKELVEFENFLCTKASVDDFNNSASALYKSLIEVIEETPAMDNLLMMV